jgi:micrococcal nuclease
VAALGVGTSGCALDPGRCGPSQAEVVRVIDGDTVELSSGERVRYLLVDTPEITGGKNDCYGQEASDFNRALVEGKQVTLTYDEECTDGYDRLLAYIEVDGREVNQLLVERGLACVLIIPPNGDEYGDAFRELEREAEAGLVGMWGACEDVACD